MIVVHINPAGVEAVYFQSDSDLAEDLCLAIWPLVREDLDRLNKKLRRGAKETLEAAASIRVMSEVWKHSSATGAELLVMLALADFSNDQGESYPSLRVIAQKARLSVRGVCKILDRLQASGEVRRDRSRGGKNRRTRYFINPPNSEQHSLNGIQRTVYSEPGDTQTVNGGSHAINRHRTVNNGVSRKRSHPNREKRDPRVKEFIDWFAVEYKARFARPYHVKGGKEGTLIKALFPTYDLPTLKRCAIVLFESDDDFLSKTDRGIGILSNQINKLAGMIDESARCPLKPSRPLPEPLDYANV